MAVSTVPAVKAALLSRIDSATDAATTVSWGVPRGDKQRDWVMIGKALTEQSPAAVGQQRREERYTVTVTVTVVRADVETPQSVSERAHAIVGQIEDNVRSDATLGGVANLIHAQVTKTDPDDVLLVDDAGQPTGRRMTEVIVHVTCLARI